MSVSAQIGEVTRPLAPSVPIPSDNSPLTILPALKTVLDAARAADAATLSPPSRAALLAALRVIEARVYTDAQLARYEEAEQGLITTLNDIRAAHDKHCTCAN